LTFDLTRQSAHAFRTFGFVVLRGFFEPSPLAAEIDRVMGDGLGADVSRGGRRPSRDRSGEQAARSAQRFNPGSNPADRLIISLALFRTHN
jgi:hypothetical protein